MGVVRQSHAGVLAFVLLFAIGCTEPTVRSRRADVGEEVEPVIDLRDASCGSRYEKSRQTLVTASALTSIHGSGPVGTDPGRADSDGSTPKPATPTSADSREPSDGGLSIPSGAAGVTGSAKAGMQMRGWSGELLPFGMRRGDQTPLLIWKNPQDVGAIEIEMIAVPAGDFRMGDDVGGRGDEKPRHSHSLPLYFVGRTETTWGQFRSFCRATGRIEPEVSPRLGAKDDQPVVNVSWDDANSFCEWAGLVLPTEAMWEKAARGTDGRKYPWGDVDPTPDTCRFSGSSKLFAAPVGSHDRDSSPFGALDMAGNVSEWCADWYDPESYEKYSRGDASPPKKMEFRVSRGGSWDFGSGHCRAASRYYVNPPGIRSVVLGFRPAKIPE